MKNVLKKCIHAQPTRIERALWETSTHRVFLNIIFILIMFKHINIMRARLTRVIKHIKID